MAKSLLVLYGHHFKPSTKNIAQMKLINKLNTPNVGDVKFFFSRVSQNIFPTFQIICIEYDKKSNMVKYLELDSSPALGKKIPFLVIMTFQSENSQPTLTHINLTSL